MRTLSTDSLLLLSSLFFSVLIMTSSAPKGYYKTSKFRAHTEINRQFKQDLNTFSAEMIAFQKALDLEKPNTSIIFGGYRDFRKAFKKVAFLIEYLDKEAYDKTLNGAPLPKLEQKVADLRILEPKGIQVMDELMAEITPESLQDLKKELTILQKSFAQVKKFLESKQISDRQFFEASRQALVRIASLGITGFDTPGTQLGIEDAYTVLGSLKGYYAFYQKEFENIHDTELYSKTLQLFEAGQQMASGTDFNTFNRLRFLKKSVNPLYQKLLEGHLALQYETIDEVSSYLPAVNYQAENIFSKDFLNPFYYVSLENDSLFEAKKELGKLLFYDPILSNNQQMSCATCHAPEKAFTDGFPKSLSNTGEAMKRNSLTLSYSVYATGFFHDLRTKRLEDQFEHVVLSKEEFNTGYQEIAEKLSKSPTYLSAFQKAFPSMGPTLKSYAVDYALAAYVISLNQFNSPIDTYFTQEETVVSEEIEKGFNLFTGKANCASCHFLPLFSGAVPPLFNDTEAEVIGVPISATDSLTVDPDLGRLENGMTQEVAYFYKHAFKTPSLRNIALTAPYMHNGIYTTLEEVVDFYNKGGGAGMGMDLPHQTLAAEPLGLTQEEIQQLVVFMEALTDTTRFEAPKQEVFPRDFKKASWNNRNL
ncbi:MAG: cytochrome-c peroxidase [Alteromonas sp.]|nr:cytochrome-c peroxidase [Alteromonas sp.]MAY21914.1 cytochrome-c peroxidase [Flavobacteriaceae bacterium]